MAKLRKAEVILSTFDLVSAIMSSIWMIPFHKFKSIDYPRNDLLFIRGVKAKSFLRSLGDKKLVIYLPTTRKPMDKTLYEYWDIREGLPISDKLFFLSGFDIEKFVTFLKQNKLFLIIKPHIYDTFVWEKSGVIKDINIRYSNTIKIITLSDLFLNDMDLYEVLPFADMLITEYSSVYNDYLLLDRPIVFWVPDFQDNIIGVVWPNCERIMPGQICTSQDCLEEAIPSNLENPARYKMKREYMKNLIHICQDGKSSYRVWQLIDNMLKGWDKQ